MSLELLYFVVYLFNETFNLEFMTVEEQMKLWDERENDKVGKLISFAYDETEDVLTYFDIWGIEHNPIKLVLDEYTFDGDAKRALKNLKNILHFYEICNFDNVESSNNVELAKKIVEFENGNM